MDPKLKKELRQWGILLLLGGILYATGLHTEVIGFAQRGLLATGLLNPKVGLAANKGETASYPMADYNLKLVDAEGKMRSLEEFREKVIFMNFWATWCAPCIAEMPNIHKLYQDVQHEDLVFIMLSVDDEFEKAKAFNKRKGYNFDLYQVAGPVPEVYHATSIPTTYLINKQGNIVLEHKGMGNYNSTKFKASLQDLLQN